MPARLSWLLEIVKDSSGHWNWPWIGAALVAVGTVIATIISALWAVFKFFVERKKAEDKKRGDRNVTQSGQGAASGRDTNFQGPVSFAPSPELVAQIQKPLADELAAQRAQIENLTKMLLERNPVAAGPGAQQAVGEAVQSIAQGAAEGDTRLQQALELLKANKTTEAEPLLKACRRRQDRARRAGPEGSGDCLPQPRCHRRAARSESCARGLRPGRGSRSRKRRGALFGRLVPA